MSAFAVNPGSLALHLYVQGATSKLPFQHLPITNKHKTITMSKKVTTNIDDFDDANAVTSNFVAFNVPLEDKIMGTLIAIRQVESTLPEKRGQMTTVYDIKADYGSFHKLDDMKKIIPDPIVVESGEIWTIGKESVVPQMRNVKIGQKVGFKFIEEVPAKTKGYNPAKIVRVFTPKNEDGTYKFDTEWLQSEGLLDTNDAPFD